MGAFFRLRLFFFTKIFYLYFKNIYIFYFKARKIKLNAEIQNKLIFLFNATKNHLYSPVDQTH